MNEKSRPCEKAAIPIENSSQSTASDRHHPIAGPESSVYFRNCYAVLVRGKTIRRHLYFNLPAADRVVKRALARGDRADLVLVRLVPVDARHLDDGDDL